MDNNINRNKNQEEQKMTISQEEIKLMAIQAIEQLMRDLFIKLWISLLEEIKDKQIDAGMVLNFKGEKIILTEYQALGLILMLKETKQA